MQNLPVKVGKLHNIRIYDAQLAYPGGSQVKGGRASNPPGRRSKCWTL